jgi:replicative DNA helicase
MAKPRPSPDRLPPHSDEAEAGVLGCIMLSPIECLDICAETMRAGEAVFYAPQNGLIYRAMLALQDDLSEIDPITIYEKLKGWGKAEEIGGMPTITKLLTEAVTPAAITSYIEILNKKFQLRNLLRACTAATEQIFECNGEVDSIVSYVERNILSVEKNGVKPTLDSKMAGDRMIDDLERRMNLNGKLSGLDTGFKLLNYMTQGIQYGEQMIIGARPSQGKTALGLTILTHAGFSGVPCLFVSLEMSIEAIMRRMCSIKTRVPLKIIREGTYDDGAMSKFAIFRGQLNKAPIFFADGVDGYGIREIASRINRMVLKHGIKLVVIDYLQKIRASEKQEKRTYEVAEVSQRLKALAYDNNVAMITLAQLNRENVKGEKKEARAPRLSDLADSGQIERDADVVGLIHREGNNAKLIIAKQRDGEVGSVPLYFDATYAQFISMDGE